MPGLTEEKEECLKIVVLDETYTFGGRFHTMRAYELSPKTPTQPGRFIDLHGNVLKFRKGVTVRPSIESLYICALLAILKRRRYQCPGWENDFDRLFR